MNDIRVGVAIGISSALSLVQSIRAANCSARTPQLCFCANARQFRVRVSLRPCFKSLTVASAKSDGVSVEVIYSELSHLTAGREVATAGLPAARYSIVFIGKLERLNSLWVYGVRPTSMALR